MKKCLEGFVTILSLLVCIVTAFFWGVCQERRVNLVWASGRERYDVISDAYMVYWLQNHNWWCEIKLRLHSEPSSERIPIEKWVGMQDVTRSSFLGIARARGILGLAVHACRQRHDHYESQVGCQTGNDVLQHYALRRLWCAALDDRLPLGGIANAVCVSKNRGKKLNGYHTVAVDIFCESRFRQLTHSSVVTAVPSMPNQAFGLSLTREECRQLAKEIDAVFRE